MRPTIVRCCLDRIDMKIVDARAWFESTPDYMRTGQCDISGLAWLEDGTQLRIERVVLTCDEQKWLSAILSGIEQRIVGENSKGGDNV